MKDQQESKEALEHDVTDEDKDQIHNHFITATTQETSHSFPREAHKWQAKKNRNTNVMKSEY